MKLVLEKIYEGPQLVAITAGVIFLRMPVDGQIKSVRIIGSGNVRTLTTWRWNVRVNGAALFSGHDRPAFVTNNLDVTKSGLSVNALQGQIITLDLEQSASGRLAAPITLIVEFEYPEAISLGMSDLVDVDLDGLQDGDTLLWDESDGKWKVGTPDSGLPSYNAALTVTTASIGDGSSDNVALMGAKSLILSKVTVDKPCRVRVYRNAAARAADASRPIGTAPDFASEHLLVYEHVFETGHLSKFTNYAPVFINAESTRTNEMPIRVTNMSGSSGTVQIDIEALILEG